MSNAARRARTRTPDYDSLPMKTSRRTGWSSERHGPTALIVGASHGISAVFATELASAGSGLVLVARHAGPLTGCADGLRERYGVDIRTINVDAGTAAGRDALATVMTHRMRAQKLVPAPHRRLTTGPGG